MTRTTASKRSRKNPSASAARRSTLSPTISQALPSVEELKHLLRRSRLSERLSQDELAAMTGLPHTTISNWENLKLTALPDWRQLLVLRRVLVI